MSTKSESQKSKRDFLIGAASGAGAAVAGFPFEKITDPITSQNYEKALRLDVEEGMHIPEKMQSQIKTDATTGKKFINRSYPRFVGDQMRTIFHRNPYTKALFFKEWMPLLPSTAKKSIGFGAGTLITGALYRAFGDKQPTEKQAALKLIGNLFNESTRNINR